MLLISFSIHFLLTPKGSLSTNEKAEVRIARMEASIQGKSQIESGQKDTSKFLDALKSKQAKQMEYLSIVVILLGAGFLGYSFIPKKEDNQL